MAGIVGVDEMTGILGDITGVWTGKLCRDEI
jgi:hypothetical protein